MKHKLTTAAMALLAIGLVASYASASDATPPEKKTTVAKKAQSAKAKMPAPARMAKPAPPKVEDEIQDLRREFQSQIDGLKSNLAEKDAQLKQAQQAAAEAQAAAAKAQAAADAGQQAVTENSAAVSTLQSTVSDLKANTVSIVTTISDETANIKKSINNPNVLHYKGITITPGGFVAAETVYRTKATGGDIPTAFSSIPYEHGDAYSLSEFFGSARQSRLTLLAEGKTTWGTLRGYYEADFLGAGITSNNNQSNSYVLRQRVVYAQAETNSHWTFVGGQLWSLAAEQKKGITSVPGDVASPQTIDPNYVPGFVWTRQYGFRVVKNFKNAAFGISAENPQLLYTASLAGNTPYAVIGSAGQNGGNYNAGISACSPSTSIVNYTDQVQTDSVGNTVHVAVPVYKTVNGCSNVANLSFNQAPDIIGKLTLDPKVGHFEFFGIAGFAHETVYPGETTDRYLYGGLTDVATGLTIAPSLTVAGAYSNSIILGGAGGSARIPLLHNKLSVGVKGLWGPGVGRYGNTTLADVTANASGQLQAINNASGLITLEANPTPRLSIYVNYGGDYAGRTDFGVINTSTTPGVTTAGSTTTLGAPSAQFCANLQGAITCVPTLNQQTLLNSGGKWGGHWGTPANAAVGYGSVLLSNSGCITTSNPGYNGGASTGYAPGGSCGAQTRDVQEVTAGYWYDIYRGDRGRLRQGVQYGYAVREAWSGFGATGPVTNVPGIGAKGIDNMFWTTFRYYLP